MGHEEELYCNAVEVEHLQRNLNVREMHPMSMVGKGSPKPVHTMTEFA